ncbi:MAG: PAS domain S-box protein, partial [bacterium]
MEIESNIRKQFRTNLERFESKLPLEKFIPGAFLIFLLCLFVLCILIYRNIQEYNNALDSIDHTNVVINKVGGVYSDIIELSVLRRGFMISGDESYLTNFNSIEKKLNVDIPQLRELTSDNELQTSLANSIDSLAKENIGMLSSTILMHKKDSTNEKFQIEVTNHIQKNIEQINRMTKEVQSNEYSLLKEKRANANVTNFNTQLIIILTGAFSFLVIGLSMLLSDKLIKNKNRAERLVRKSYEELEDKVEDRTSELKESNTKLTTEVNNRMRSERFLKIQYEVSKTLFESKSEEEALKKVLENVCCGIEWSYGVLWTVEKDDSLKVLSTWGESGGEKNEYSKIYDSNFRLKRNKGLPGKVVSDEKSIWISEISNDLNFVRKTDAAKMGWKSALGIPVSNGKEVIAIIECFQSKTEEEQKDLIEVLESAGRQIGNFIERMKAEQLLKESYAKMEEKVNERTAELSTTLTKLVNEMDEKESIQKKIQLFAHAIRSIQECVYISDLEGNIIFVNEAFEKTYGFSTKDLTGKLIPIYDTNHDDQDMKKNGMKKLSSGNWKGELFTLRKDGTSFPTFLSTTIIRDESGKASAIVGICQDISEIREARDSINKTNNLLFLLNDIIHHTNKSFDLDESLHYTVNKVCEYLNWDVGLSVLNKSGSNIETIVWNDNMDPAFNEFRKVSEKGFANLAEEPLKTMQTGKAEWINLNVEKAEVRSHRLIVAHDSGLKTGVRVPVIVKNETIGVLKFFKKEELESDPGILDCITNIGIELGSLIEKLEIINLLKKSEGLLNDAQSIAKIGSWEWDVTSNMISWSHGMYTVYELTED